MKKRTKLEMKWMKEDVSEWLEKTNNDPHTAWDEYCKHLVMNNHLRSHWIKGKEDFIKVSKEFNAEIKRQQEIKQQKEISKQNKQIIIDFIMNLNFEEMKAIWNEYKNNVSQSDKLVIQEIYLMKYDNCFEEKYIDQQTINVFTPIYKQSLQPA